MSCKLHSGEPLIKVCMKDDCSSNLLCQECMINHAYGHSSSYLDYENVFDKQKNLILFKKIFSNCNDRIVDLKTKIKNKKEDLTGKLQELITEARTQINQLIDSQHKKYLDELDSIFDHNVTELEQWQTDLKKQSEDTENKENIKKLRSQEEKIKDNLGQYNVFRSESLQSYNLEMEQYQQFLEDKQIESLLQRSNLEQIQNSIQNFFDLFPLFRTGVIGSRKLDENQLHRFELKKKFTVHEDWINTACFIDDKNIVATASADKTIKLVDLNTFSEINTFEGHTDVINCMIYLKQDHLVTGSQDKTIRVWNLKNPQVQDFIFGHERAIKCLAKIDDNTIISGSADKTVKVWEVEKKQFLCDVRDQEDQVHSVLHLKQNLISYGIGNGKIKIRDYTQKYEQCTIEAHKGPVKQLIYISGRKILISSSQDNTIKLWNEENDFRIIKTYKEHQGAVNALLDIQSERYFISGGWDSFIHIYDIDKDDPIHVYRDQMHYIESICYMRDGKTLVSVGADTDVRVWQIKIQKEVELFKEQIPAIQTQHQENKCECSIF